MEANMKVFYKDITSIELSNVAGLPEKGIAIIKTDAEEFVVDYEILVDAVNKKRKEDDR